MKPIVTLNLRLRTVSESNARGHWAKKAARAKEQRSMVVLVLRSTMRPPVELCWHVVALTRIAPRALDDDNLRGALKACRDGVADWLGIDDRDRRVRWEYAQERGAAKAYGVRVEVFEIETTETAT